MKIAPGGAALARALYTSFALVVALVGLVFHLRNQQRIELDYFFGRLEVDLSVAMLIMLLIGCLLGIVAMSASYLKLKHALRRLAREKDIVGRELASLRELTVKDVR